MPLIRKEIQGRPVKLFVLPPSTGHFARRWLEFCASDDIFGLDVETTAIDEDQGTFDPNMKLRAVQFGTADQGWLLDANDPFWREQIRELLATSKRFVSHTNYDVLWIRREFGINLFAEGRSIDTFPMACLLRPGERRPKDLKTLSRVFIDDQLHDAEVELTARFKELAPKGERVGKRLKAWGFTNIPLDDPVFGSYGALDAVYVRLLLDILSAKLKETGMAKLSRREQRIERIMTGVQVRGHRLDAEYTLTQLDEVNREFDGANARLWEAFGFTPGSPKVGAWLVGHGVQFWEYTPTGRPKISKDTLPYLVDQHDEETLVGKVLRDLLTLSERKNLRNNLGICYRAQDADGFVHPRILTQQAVTGRMAIRSPAMQTFKKGPIRGCFIAREGHVFVGADYYNQETCLAAAFSGDPNYTRIVTERLNMHELTGALIFGDAFVDKDSSVYEYKAAKILDFAQQYGAGPRKIAAQLGIELGEAKKLWLAWRKAYAGLVRWSENLSRYRSVTNPWDRLIPADPFRPYANGNFAIQSSGRDMLGDAICNLDDAGWADTIWLPIHDELILEVPLEMAHSACYVLEDAMRTNVGDIQMTATAEIIGDRWWPLAA